MDRYLISIYIYICHELAIVWPLYISSTILNQRKMIKGKSPQQCGLFLLPKEKFGLISYYISGLNSLAKLSNRSGQRLRLTRNLNKWLISILSVNMIVNHRLNIKVWLTAYNIFIIFYHMFKKLHVLNLEFCPHRPQWCGFFLTQIYWLLFLFTYA